MASVSHQEYLSVLIPAGDSGDPAAGAGPQLVVGQSVERRLWLPLVNNLGGVMVGFRWDTGRLEGEGAAEESGYRRPWGHWTQGATEGC